MNQRISILALAGLVFTGCGIKFNRDPVIQVNGGPQKLTSTNLSFDDVQRLVFQPKCVTCHSGGKIGDFRKFEVVQQQLGLIENRALVLKDMPRSPDSLSGEQSRTLAEWISAGGPLLGSGGQTPPATPTPSAEVVDWKVLNEQLLKSKCLTCHGQDNTRKISDLSDFDTFKSTIGTIYYAAVISETMPPRPEGVEDSEPNPSALSKEEKLLISRWIIDGMKPAQ